MWSFLKPLTAVTTQPRYAAPEQRRSLSQPAYWLGTQGYLAMCPSTLTTVLFTTARIMNQPRRSSTDGQQEYIHTYTMTSFPSIKKTVIVSFAGNLAELEIIVLSKTSQTQKNKQRMCFLSYIEPKFKYRVTCMT